MSVASQKDMRAINTGLVVLGLLTIGCGGGSDGSDAPQLSGEFVRTDNTGATVDKLTFGADGVWSYEVFGNDARQFNGTFRLDGNVMHTEFQSGNGYAGWQTTYYASATQLVLAAFHPSQRGDGVVGTWAAQDLVLEGTTAENMTPSLGANFEIELREDGTATETFSPVGQPQVVLNGTWATINDPNAPLFGTHYIETQLNGETVLILLPLVDDTVIGDAVYQRL